MFKDSLEGLGQFLATESLQKMMFKLDKKSKVN